MKTPAGIECKHYYEDFHRGHNVQECRLIKQNRDSLPWHPGDCLKCPVPALLNANASPYLELKVTIKPRFLGMKRQPIVTATCTKHHTDIDDAFVGCSKCNAERPNLNLFWQALEQSEDPDNH